VVTARSHARPHFKRYFGTSVFDFAGVEGTCEVLGELAGAPAGVPAGALGEASDFWAGTSFITPDITPPPPAGPREPKYVSVRLVRKKTVAAAAVERLKKLAEPAEPNTLPAEPEPNAAPMSAPLPCWISTNTISATAAIT
jgi:hypothetical protein